MARVILGPGGTYAYQGKAGHAVYCNKGGQTIIGQKPVRKKREPTPAQQAVQDRFAEGASYARHALEDPELREMYEAEALASGLSARNVAMRDYIKRPTITEVDLSFRRAAPTGVLHQVDGPIPSQHASTLANPADASSPPLPSSTARSGGPGN